MACATLPGTLSPCSDRLLTHCEIVPQLGVQLAAGALLLCLALETFKMDCDMILSSMFCCLMLLFVFFSIAQSARYDKICLFIVRH